MMTERVRIGVVGTGHWAAQMHLPALKSHPQAEVVALCAHCREHAAELAREHDIPLVFDDHRAMIDKAELHALVVTTYDDEHYPVTMDALDAGLHVVCEKPLALNAAQARAMYEKAESRRRKHMTFFRFRWWPHHRYVKKLLDSGWLGRPYHCDIRFIGGYARGTGYTWRFDGRRANGVLGDLGSHAIDWARWYMGDIARVSAHLATFVERMDADGHPIAPANDYAVLLLQFANGSQGTIELSGVAHLGPARPEHHIYLHGQAGTLHIYRSAVGAELQGVRGGEEALQAIPIPEELCGEVDPTDRAQMRQLFFEQAVGDRLFVDAILNDAPLTPTFYDGLKAQEVIDAAIASHRSGQWEVP